MALIEPDDTAHFDYLSEAQPDEPPIDDDVSEKDKRLERRLMANEIWAMECAESTYIKPL